MREIQIVDEMMGTGKTTAIFKRMKENPQEKYLYITPIISELNRRLPTDGEGLDFVQPNNSKHKRKCDHLKELIEAGRNIGFTHSLFLDMSLKLMQQIRDQQYNLIVDEEVCMIEELREYTKGDIKSLHERGDLIIDQENFGKVSFKWDIPVDQKFYKLKQMCDTGCVYATSGNAAFVVQLPLELLTSAKTVTLLTYGFFGSMFCSFLECRGFTFKRLDLPLKKTSLEAKQTARRCVELVDHIGIRKVQKYSKSYTWWTEDSTDEQKKEVLKSISGIARKYAAKSDDMLVTYPVEIYENDEYKIPKFDKDKVFLYASCRATNDYNYKTFLVHAYNRFPNPTVYNYLQQYGGSPDRDKIALFEMLQWIWRSAIREDKPIKLCIANRRMKELFEDWLVCPS